MVLPKRDIQFFELFSTIFVERVVFAAAQTESVYFYAVARVYRYIATI